MFFDRPGAIAAPPNNNTRTKGSGPTANIQRAHPTLRHAKPDTIDTMIDAVRSPRM